MTSPHLGDGRRALTRVRCVHARGQWRQHKVGRAPPHGLPGAGFVTCKMD
jgi:hypothetical protein